MADKIEGLSIDLDLNTTKLDRGLKGSKDQMKTLNSELKNNMSAFDRSDRTIGKYETRLGGLNKKLGLQKKVTSEAKVEYEKMVAEHGKGSVEAEKAAREYNNQSAQLNNLSRYVDGVRTDLEKLKEEQRIANSRWTKMGDKLEAVGGKMQNAGKKMSAVGGTLTRRVSLPLLAVGGAAAKVGSDFEAGMSKVQAVSGASADEMEQLEEKAREMGKTTVFSAKETTDAFYYMSLSGWDASESMDGVSGMMDLAAASGEELASVSNIVTDGLSAFSLEAKDSGRMADVLAAASANANTDVKGLGDAFSYVAPVAGSLGFTMEDTSKAIGLMADNGIKGQKAGTQLRKMMSNLAKPTDEAAGLMEEYGINLEDSEGNMKSFDDVMGDLRKGLGDLDEKQQAQAASTLFGKEAMSGALSIINTSEKDYDKLTDAIEGSDGAAGEMADTMQDNLQGSLKELKSMAEDLFIELYQNLKPTIESVVDGVKDAVQWFGDLSPKTKDNIVKFGLLAAAAGPVIKVLGVLTGGLGAVVTGAGRVSKTLGVVSGKGMLGRLGGLAKGGVVGLAIGGVAALAGGIYKLAQKQKDAREVSMDHVDELKNQYKATDDMIGKYSELKDESNLTNQQFERYVDLNSRLEDETDEKAIENIKEEMKKLKKESGFSNDELDTMVGLNADLADKLPGATDKITDQGNAIIGTREEMEKLNEETRRQATLEMEQEFQKAAEQYNEKLRERDALEGNVNQQKSLQTEIDNTLKNFNEGNRQDLIARIRSEKDILNEKLKSKDITNEEAAEYANQLNQLDDIEESVYRSKDGLRDQLITLKEQTTEDETKLINKEQELTQTRQIYKSLQSQFLEEAGINKSVADKIIANGKVEDSLNEQLSKLREQKAELKKQKEAGELTTTEYRRAKNEIDGQIDKMKDAKGNINQLESDARDYSNELARDVSKTTTTNTLEEQTRADVLNDKLGIPRKKKLKLYQSGLATIELNASRPITKKVNLTPGTRLSAAMNNIAIGNAEGTKGHPGGHAVMGDGKGSNAGSELVNLPNGKSFLSAATPTLYPNLPKGTEVISAKKTKRMLQGVKHYADGVRNSEFSRLIALNGKRHDSPISAGEKNTTQLLSATLEQNRIALEQNQLLTQLIKKNSDVYIDGREAGKIMEPHLSRQLERERMKKSRALGRV